MPIELAPLATPTATVELTKEQLWLLIHGHVEYMVGVHKVAPEVIRSADLVGSMTLLDSLPMLEMTSASMGREELLGAQDKLYNAWESLA